MAALVETMFSVREKPWHGLGTIVSEAPDSQKALELAGLDWNVIQKDIITSDGSSVILGFKANVRDKDNSVLGIVTDRYKVVQNSEAFAFTDELLGEGVRYETAGSLQGGRRTWLLARLPHQYIINGEEISPFLVFMNAHDGSSAIKVAMTPVRVVCSNTLNLALSTAKRSWSCYHTGDINGKMDEARNTLLFAGKYMAELGKSFDELGQIKLQDSKVIEFINELIPEPDNASPQQQRNIIKLREDAKSRYFDAPDLQGVGKNGYRFINAISDFSDKLNELLELRRKEKQHYQEKEALIADTYTNLSHDIRTPLTSLDGYFQLMEECENIEDQKRYLSIIHERIHSLNEMLEELFMFTKLKNESYSLELTLCCMNRILKETVFSYYDEWVRMEIQPDIQITEEQLYIHGNRQGLCRVIQNVIKNGLDHGEKKISIVLERDQNQAVLRISNQVTHPEQINIDQVFERFYKADVARSKTSTGLGLSIAKELVSRMDGEIEAKIEKKEFIVEMNFPIVTDAK